MKKFSVNDAVFATNGRFFGTPDILLKEISGVVIDNRKVESGFAFMPIKGERFDGHDFITSAFESGAVVCFSEKHITDGPYILVKDTTAAFRDLAEYYKSLFDIKTVGITGSVGKTTTKEMITSVLSKQFNTLYTLGNLNNQTGVPLTVFRLEEEHEAAVIEMGTNHFGEIESVAKVARPDFCVLTNVGEAHIEFLGSKAGILKAKTEMLKYMKDGGKVFVNGDDEYLKKLTKKRNDVITFGLSENCDIYAKDIKTKGLFGSDFTCVIKNIEFEMSVPAPGIHMVYNALAGVAVGRAYGMDMDDITQGIADYKPIAGRMCIETKNDITVLNDVYNANPGSMRSAIDVLNFAEGRKVCILGDMYELGEESENKHFETGKYAADKKINCIICVGTLSKAMFEGAQKAHGNAFFYESQDELLAEIGNIVKKGDTVLVKASRGMHLEKTVEFLLR